MIMMLLLLIVSCCVFGWWYLTYHTVKGFGESHYLSQVCYWILGGSAVMWIAVVISAIEKACK